MTTETTETKRLDSRDQARVPFDGDVAHRQGFALNQNPWPDHKHAEYNAWQSDWLFRHEHAPHGAADAPGGRLRPSKTAAA